MPGTYAHYAFGKKVLAQLDDEIKNIILKNMDLFFIGLHGPDILFYYKPLIYNNPTSKLGHKIHNENSNIFFEKARSIIKKSNNKEESLVYILGFLCHFMLDSECHPYINKVTQENNLSHTEIESEFDKLLINEGCKNIKTLYNNSIDKTLCMMDNFYTSLKENRPFHQRLNRNFK